MACTLTPRGARSSATARSRARAYGVWSRVKKSEISAGETPCVVRCCMSAGRALVAGPCNSMSVEPRASSSRESSRRLSRKNQVRFPLARRPAITPGSQMKIGRSFPPAALACAAAAISAGWSWRRRSRRNQRIVADSLMWLFTHVAHRLQDHQPCRYRQANYQAGRGAQRFVDQVALQRVQRQGHGGAVVARAQQRRATSRGS